MKILAVTIVLLSITFDSKSQYISSVDYLKLFNYTQTDNAVNDVNRKLTGLSKNWKFDGGKEDGNVLTIKWNYIGQNQTLTIARFTINTIKRNDEQLVKKISYSFLDERWFNEYVNAVKSLDGVNLVYSQKESDGVIKQVYQTSTTVHIFNIIPYNKRNIPYRYNVEMHYNLK